MAVDRSGGPASAGEWVGAHAMIRLYCECGAKLKTRLENVGRRIRCPKCGKTTRVRPIDAELGAAASSSAASRPPTPPEGVSGDLALDAGSSGVLETRRGSSPPARANGGDAPPPVELLVFADDSPPPPPLPKVEITPEEAAEEALRGRRRRTSVDVIEPPARGFWADAGLSFAYPFMPVGNTTTFIIVAIMSAAREVLAYAPCIGLIGQLCIFGWLAAFFMNVVAETCSGKDDMPGIVMAGGAWDDIIRPALRFVAVTLVCMLPAGLLMATILVKRLPPGPMLVFVVGAVGLGLFLWPMVMLLFSLDEAHQLVRVDLIAATLVRSFFPYLAIFLLLGVIAVLSSVTSLSFVAAKFLSSGAKAFDLSANVSLRIAMDLVSTYFSVVSMRMIGLYYRHFKQRFAFRLE